MLLHHSAPALLVWRALPSAAASRCAAASSQPACSPQPPALWQLRAQVQGVQVLPAVQRRLDCTQQAGQAGWERTAEPVSGAAWRKTLQGVRNMHATQCRQGTPAIASPSLVSASHIRPASSTARSGPTRCSWPSWAYLTCSSSHAAQRVDERIHSAHAGTLVVTGKRQSLVAPGGRAGGRAGRAPRSGAAPLPQFRPLARRCSCRPFLETQQTSEPRSKLLGPRPWVLQGCGPTVWTSGGSANLGSLAPAP